MKNFFRRIGEGFRAFMAGRYGSDELSVFLSFAGLALLLLSSRNTLKRRREREVYLSLLAKVRQRGTLLKNRFRERKTHRYYACPNCRVTIRIPKPEKGRTIAITCPKCGTRFEKKI